MPYQNASPNPEVVRPSRGLRRLLRAVHHQFTAARSFVCDWQWGAVVGRVGVAALGLVLLGAIGRSARARDILTADSPPVPDAGLAAVSLPSSSVPSAAPAASLATVSTSPVGLATAAAATPESVANPPAPNASAPQGTRTRATPDDPVYLNQATLDDLHRLPGIGPKRAEAILTLRNRLGHFRQVEDLLKVKGVGRAALRKLRPLVRLDPPPAHGADAGSDAPS